MASCRIRVLAMSGALAVTLAGCQLPLMTAQAHVASRAAKAPAPKRPAPTRTVAPTAVPTTARSQPSPSKVTPTSTPTPTATRPSTTPTPTPTPTPTVSSTAPSSFVTATGTSLKLNGASYRFAGTNAFWLGTSDSAANDAFDSQVKAAGFNGMRTWGFADCGYTYNNTGSCYQTFTKGAAAPVYSDAALKNLDYAIYRARQAGTHVVIPLTNNWQDLGGMDTYVWAAGDTDHSDFYTGTKEKQWYQAWVSHLLNHVNSYTGVAYKNDPTILAWQLANEPRCETSSCDKTSGSTVTTWASVMSTYVKSIDHNHLVGLGDEGFTCNPGASVNWDSAQDCYYGDNASAIANLPNINFVGMHLYPGSWGETDDWGTSWIASHAALGKTAGKPTIVDEFDTSDVTGDPAWFATWTQEADRDGVAGWLVWSLLAVDGNGKPFSWAQGITCPGTPTGACSVLEQSAKSLIGS